MKVLLAPGDWWLVIKVTNCEYKPEHFIELTKVEFEELQELNKKFNEWQVRFGKAWGDGSPFGWDLIAEDMVWKDES